MKSLVFAQSLLKCIFVPLLVFITIQSHAQIPGKSITDRNVMLQREMNRLEQLMLADLEITENQQMYDVKYYNLNLTPDPGTSSLNGIAEIRVEVVAASLPEVELNFADNMAITNIHNLNSPGTQLTYNRENDYLNISLDRTYIKGEIFNISISYNGKPQESENFGFGFGFSEYMGEPMIWSFSQPWGARAWWPCKDVPSDKADSIDIRVTVPNKFIVASNGSLRQKTTKGNNTTYWWHENYPIATYLVSLAIYPYEVHYDDFLYNENADTMKIHFYSFPGNYENYAGINSKVKSMLGFFTEMFGEYPFIDEKYGHADFTEGGAIEHQTCTSFNFWNESLYAHELAHQWWGNMVTYNDWHSTWLGEGFATYSEALWHEHNNGPGTASDFQIANNLYRGGGTVYIADLENESPLNWNLVYKKASWVLHMLRHMIGDEKMVEVFHAFRNSKHGYASATTEDFQAVCEQVTGMDLSKYFHQWIYEEYFPRYSFEWNAIQDGSHYNVDLKIHQNQINHLFWMPLDIRITSADAETSFVVWDSLKTQQFSFTVDFEPTSLELDPDNWVLKKIEQPFVDPSFDKTFLLVNGIAFDVYGDEIYDAYQNMSFLSELKFDFWDCMDAPAKPYPAILPDPLGHGLIPDTFLGRYENIIWFANNYRGDLNIWSETSIQQYLNAGGNLILVTRYARDFLTLEMKQNLGVKWVGYPGNTINNCISTHPGLIDMGIPGGQSATAVFETSLTSTDAILLFKETSSFAEEMGLGVWYKPVNGGIYNQNGGQIVLINGRPYRYNSADFSYNILYILTEFFGAKLDIDGKPGTGISSYKLFQNYPNPFNPKTIISWQLAVGSDVEVSVYNLLGQKIVTLISERQKSGNHQIEWDAGGFASGLYFYRLKTDRGFIKTKKLLLFK